MKIKKCEHRKIKKNYPFGRKSRARKVCKNCGEIVTNLWLFQKRKRKQKYLKSKDFKKEGEKR